MLQEQDKKTEGVTSTPPIHMCDICGRQFALAKSLRHHKLRVHRISIYVGRGEPKKQQISTWKVMTLFMKVLEDTLQGKRDKIRWHPEELAERLECLAQEIRELAKKEASSVDVIPRGEED